MYEGSPIPCRVEDCGRVAVVKRQALCHGHYTQHRQGQPLSPIRSKRARGIYSERDEQGNKHCLLCNQFKPPASFARGAGSDGLQTFCRSCRSERYYKAQRDEVLNKRRLKLYGLTTQQFEAKVEQQGGRCAVCGSPDPVAMDHDHGCCPSETTCGQCLRDVLCTNCNTGLGMVHDDIAVLMSMVAYLSRHSRDHIPA
jgi:hypothetical protein